MTSPSSLSTERASPRKLLALTAWRLHERRYPSASPLGSSLAPPPAPKLALLVPAVCLGWGLGTGRGEGRAHSPSLRHLRTPSHWGRACGERTEAEGTPASQHSFSKLSPALGTKASEVT